MKLVWRLERLSDNEVEFQILEQEGIQRGAHDDSNPVFISSNGVRFLSMHYPDVSSNTVYLRGNGIEQDMIPMVHKERVHGKLDLDRLNAALCEFNKPMAVKEDLEELLK